MKYVLIVDHVAVANFYENADEETAKAFSKLFNDTIGMNRFSRNEILCNFINEYYAKIGK